MSFTVAPIAFDERAAAARLLVAHEPATGRDRSAVRCLDLLASGELDVRGLFGASDDSGALCGVVLVQPLPGALGLAWPPRMAAHPDRHAIEGALLGAACGWLRNRGVKVCQAFAAACELPAFAPLARHGFRHITQVLHLRCENVGLHDVRDATDLPIAMQRYRPPLRGRFREVLLATYDGSCDCPELNGTRTPDEMLAAFGEREPPHWFLAEERGTPLGVLMLDSSSEPRTLEIAYLGLLPAARGRGFGDALVRSALQSAHDSGIRSLTLSVDVRNEPALRLYRRHGFTERDRQEVFLAAWPDLSAS